MVGASSAAPAVPALLMACGLAAWATGPRTRARLVLAGLGYGAFTTVGSLWLGLGQQPALALGLRVASGVVWAAWLANTTSWSDVRRRLVELGAPRSALTVIDDAVVHGGLLFAMLSERHALRTLRVGRRLQLVETATVLASGVERAFDRGARLTDTRMLREALDGGAGGAPAVSVTSASITLDGRTAIDGVGFALSAGERVLLVGPSGAGKSTLLAAIAGLLPLTTGSIHRLGREVTGGTVASRVHGAVAWIGQDPDDQLQGPTAREEVVAPLLARGVLAAEAEARVDESLAAVGLAGFADRDVHRLSYGERKRLVVAAALALRPRLILCDEPTAGLDPRSARRLLSALDVLLPRDAVVIWATHEGRLRPAGVDRVIVMDEGRMVADGPLAATDVRRSLSTLEIDV